MKISNEKDELFGVICGEHSGAEVLAIGIHVRLIFHSDSEFQKEGFLIDFTATEKSGEYNHRYTYFNTLSVKCGWPNE